MPDQTIRVGTTLDLIARFLVDEVQEITSTMTEGAFVLGVGAGQTRPIPWDGTWQDLEDAITQINAVGRAGVICTGGPLPNHPIHVRFTGRTGKHTQPPLQVVSGDVAITTVTDGGPILLDELPVITVTRQGSGTSATPDVTDLGGGAYQSQVIPDRAGSWSWTAAGASTAHGVVTARGTFTVA